MGIKKVAQWVRAVRGAWVTEALSAFQRTRMGQAAGQDLEAGVYGRPPEGWRSPSEASEHEGKRLQLPEIAS